jgi:hypothetical protein
MGLLETIVIFGTPLLLVGLFVVPFLRVGVDLADEGYLVYGVSCLLKGQIPVRDFRAYDPGRYYWCGLFALIFGRGNFATRMAMAVTLAMGLSVVAALVLSATGVPLLSMLMCALALIWMQPRHKQIENFFTILGVFVLCNLFGNSTPFDYAVLGAVIGFSAFFGLNSFVYLVGASVLTFGFGIGVPALISVYAFGLGLAVGLLPICALCIGAKGYATSYWHRKVAALVKRGTTNLKIPLPWIWAKGRTGFDRLSPARRMTFKWLFTLMPVLFIAGLTVPLIVDVSEMTAAQQLIFTASCVGIVNFYHTLSRADLGHMFQPVLPLGILIAASSFMFFGAIVASILVLIAIFASVWLVWQQAFHLPNYLRNRHNLVTCETANDRFLLPAGLANQMTRLKNLTEEWSDKNDPILAVPLHIGVCAMLDRQHAAYDSFPVYPSEATARAAMINDLKATMPKIMLIGTAALDHRKELVFLNNYPEVAALIDQKYRLLEGVGLTEVYVLKDAGL